MREGTVKSRALIAAALACAGATAAFAQATPERTLRTAQSVSSPWAGPNAGILGSVQCDSAGNLYVRPVVSVVSATNDIAPVVEVKRNGAKGSEFSLEEVTGPHKYLLGANKFGQSYDFVGSFAVDAQGRVYLLSRRCALQHCDTEVVQFNRGGKYQSDTKLAVSNFVPHQLAVFSNGQFFVAGLLEGAGRPTTTYAGVFGHDGRLVSEIHFPSGPGESSAAPFDRDGPGVELSFVAADETGGVYLVRPVTDPVLYMIRDNGEVSQHSAIALPFQNAVPVGISYGGNGTVIIEFGKKIQGGVSSSGNFFSVIDVKNGHSVANYTADARTGGVFGCFLPRSGFEFLAVRKGRMAIRLDPMD
ncbi:MAG TPA: hypothetical protein VNF02_03655 [Candidatus Limnocylindrales bacterium]|nr:hypothetical protein [Candidatus Limnocylindrales bacterium]